MKILVLSHLYPPYYKGGYELMCKLVNDKLKERGHIIRILTSDFRSDKKKYKEVRNNVYRIIDYKFGEKTFFLKNLILEIRNNRILKKQIKTFKPDLISVWHCLFFSRPLLIQLTSFKIPVVYNLEDPWIVGWYYNKNYNDWLSYFVKNSTLQIFLKKILSFLVPTEWKPLNLKNTWFVSNSLKKSHLDINLPVSDGKVIYNGLGLEKFSLTPKKRKSNQVKLLWVGRITECKGTHIAIKSTALLVNKFKIKNIKLSIVGEPETDKYFSYLKDLIKKNNLSDTVIFKGKMSRDETIKEYSKHHIFLFTSIYKEPFGLTWLEAFASGIPVVGTVTGGSKEIFVNGKNALICKEDDPLSLAFGIERLIKDKKLYKKIQINAIKTIKEKKLDIDYMLNQIERLYQDALNT